MLLALQTAIQPCDMATGTMLFVAIRMLGGSIGLAIFQTMQPNELESIISKLMLQCPIDQAVVCASSTPPELSQALIDAYVVTLRAVFYVTIPFAVMIVMLAVFVHHITLCTRMKKTIEE
ncbi:hypothetical protein FBU31_001276 [Coemansia sp. 'formosensis']|nr:hypothetical protein FBU31_001276 [Coemansia sp. 'formosensis']